MGYLNFQYRHDIDAKRRRQLDTAFRRPNDVLARERELIRELRTVETQIKKIQARGVGGSVPAGLGSKTALRASAAGASSAGDDVKPVVSSAPVPGTQGCNFWLFLYASNVSLICSLSIYNSGTTSNAHRCCIGDDTPR